MNEFITNVSQFGTDITYNISMIHGDVKSMCEVDALNMLNNIEKLPSIAFMFLAIGLVILTIYLFFLKESKYEVIQKYISSDFILIPYLFFLTSTYLYIFMTFNIDTKTFFKVIEPYLYILVGLLLLKIGYDIYKRYK